MRFLLADRTRAGTPIRDLENFYPSENILRSWKGGSLMIGKTKICSTATVVGMVVLAWVAWDSAQNTFNFRVNEDLQQLTSGLTTAGMTEPQVRAINQFGLNLKSNVISFGQYILMAAFALGLGIASFSRCGCGQICSNRTNQGNGSGAPSAP